MKKAVVAMLVVLAAFSLFTAANVTAQPAGICATKTCATAAGSCPAMSVRNVRAAKRVLHVQ